MKTVITDRSLSLFPLTEQVSPNHIRSYIEAVRDAGIKYIELDFRTVMKMQELPDGIKYIFRVTDPTFAYLADAFDFDYMLVTLSDLRRPVNTSVPVIAEVPGMGVSPGLINMITEQTGGKLAMIRLRGHYPMMTQIQALQYINGLRALVTVPVDICPMNNRRTALDTAIKFSLIGADSISMTIGTSRNYVSFEEFLFTLMSVYDTIPKEFDMSSVCRAALLHNIIFRNSEDSIPRIMRLLDRDISGLINVDTGERVKLHVALRDTQYLHRTFVSALERLAQEESIPPDILQDMTDAIRHYNVGLFSDKIIQPEKKGLLN